jgi:hypothetical protein
VGLDNFIIAMAREEDKVVDVVGTPTLENEPFFASRERDLIQALKVTLQSPPPGPLKSMISIGSLMSQLGMASITTLKLRSLHGISSRILSKGNKITLSCLANLQG